MSALFGDQDPEDDVDEFTNAGQPKDDEPKAHQPFWDAKPVGNGGANTGDQLTLAGTYQYGRHVRTVP